MKSKILLFILSTVLVISFLSGCSSKPDVVTGPSRANDEAGFEKAISKDGNFIIITSKDLTFKTDLTVDGTFTKKDSTVPTRSLAFAAYKEDGKTLDKRFTVTAPKIVINSENTLLEYGIIKGDVYVQAAGFKTSDATITGNLYFKTEELKNAFVLDDKSKVTGEIGVKAYTK